MAMFKWFDPAKADQYPKRLIYLQATTLGDALELRAAKNGDDMDMVFDPETELGNLWLTILQQKLNMRSVNLQLRDAAGNFIQPEIPHPTKEDDEYGYGYTAKQLAAMPTPKNLFMLKHKFGAPCFTVGAAEYVAKEKKTPARAKVQRVALTRVTAPPALNAIAAPAVEAPTSPPAKPRLVRAGK